MKLHRIAPVALVAAAALVACGGKEQKADPYPERLYRAEKALIVKYTASLAAAKDSTAVDSIIRRFEEQMTKLNLRFPPGTDMRMPSVYNDTLYLLTAKYLKVRHKKLFPDPLEADSLRLDSIRRDSITRAAAAPKAPLRTVSRKK